MLELLDGAGELAQRVFDAVDARGLTVVDRPRWRGAGHGLGRRRRLLLLRLAAVEQIVEEAARALLRHGRAGHRQHKKGGERRDAVML